jgi:hypothetical protein
MKGVALTQAKDRKQAAAERAVSFEARGGVARARRLEAAHVAKERRKTALVHANQRNEEAGYHVGAWARLSKGGRGPAET